jgi:hypothetical protein
VSKNSKAKKPAKNTAPDPSRKRKQVAEEMPSFEGMPTQPTASSQNDSTSPSPQPGERRKEQGGPAATQRPPADS